MRVIAASDQTLRMKWMKKGFSICSDNFTVLKSRQGRENKKKMKKKQMKSIYVCLSKQSLVISFNNRLTDIWRNIMHTYPNKYDRAQERVYLVALADVNIGRIRLSL